MKKSLSFVMAMGTVLVLGVSTVFAASGLQKIQANLNHDIKFVVDGEQWTPRDQKGAKLTPISYEGSTYVPLRAVAEAVGAVVDWDDKTKTITVNSPDDSASHTIANGTVIDIKDLELSGSLAYGKEASFTVDNSGIFEALNKLSSRNSLYIPLNGEYKKVKGKAVSNYGYVDVAYTVSSTDENGNKLEEIISLNAVAFGGKNKTVYNTFEINVTDMDGIILNDKKGEVTLFDIVLTK